MDVDIDTHRKRIGLYKGSSRSRRNSSLRCNNSIISETMCFLVLIIFLSSTLLQISDFSLNMMPGPHTYSELKYESTFEKDCFKRVRDPNQSKIRVEEHLEFLKGRRDNKLMPDQLHLRFESNFALPLNTTKETINNIVRSAELNILDKGIQHYESWLSQLSKNIRNAEFEFKFQYIRGSEIC